MSFYQTILRVDPNGKTQEELTLLPVTGPADNARISVRVVMPIPPDQPVCFRPLRLVMPSADGSVRFRGQTSNVGKPYEFIIDVVGTDPKEIKDLLQKLQESIFDLERENKSRPQSGQIDRMLQSQVPLVRRILRKMSL